MDESVFRQDAYRMLRLLGYWPLRGRDATICPRCHGRILPPIGRPDIIVMAPHGLSRVLETKFVSKKDKSFAFSSITDEQREWLSKWQQAGGMGYIGIGVETRPSSFYIIDWDAWLCIEEKLLKHQATIPVDFHWGKHYLLAMRKDGLDLSTLATQYKMLRKDKGWFPPAGHSLLRSIVVEGIDGQGTKSSGGTS